MRRRTVASPLLIAPRSGRALRSLGPISCWTLLGPFGYRTLFRPLDICSIPALHRLPATVRLMLLPLTVLAPIDVAVTSSIDIAALFASDKAFVTFRRTPAQTARTSH